MVSNLNKEFHILSNPQKVNMANEWFDFVDLNHFWLRARFDMLKKHIHLMEDCKKILEIGCGNGVLIKQLENIGFIIDGCDLNIEILEKISEVKGEIFLYDVAEKNQKFCEYYDCIILFDVIEHIEEDVVFLKNVLFHLKKGGIIIMNVPALMILYSKYDRVNGHFRRYNKRNLRKLFSSLNIEELNCFYWGYLMFFFLILRKFVLYFYKESKIIEKGFVPPSGFFNTLLYKSYFIEKYLTTKLPWGTSLMIIGQKH